MVESILCYAIQLAPNFSDAYNNRGGAYYGLDQYEQAIEDFSEAISASTLRMAWPMPIGRRLTLLLAMDTEAEQDASRAIELGFPPDVLQRQIEELKKASPLRLNNCPFCLISVKIL